MKLELNFIECTEETIKELQEDDFVIFKVWEKVIGFPIKVLKVGNIKINEYFDKRVNFSTGEGTYQYEEVLEFAKYDPTNL